MLWYRDGIEVSASRVELSSIRVHSKGRRWCKRIMAEGIGSKVGFRIVVSNQTWPSHE